MATTPELPIEVGSDTLGAGIMALVRYVVALIVAVAVSRGWIDAGSAEGIAAILLAIGSTGYGIWNTWRRKRQLVAAVDMLPNSLGEVKR